ncbi:Tn3 family transposase [Streptomyces sp. NPDC087659]|uniref:Tn3 family transposase n=1 Tax=Streptomyces sp. NPDC087659 TaxID=3365801 RepID=UPI0038295EF6
MCRSWSRWTSPPASRPSGRGRTALGRARPPGRAEEADFLTGFTDEFSSVAAYERIDRATLQPRLLLALFALGTNMGIRAIVATGEHGESEAALRHVRRHFITVDNLRAAVTRLVNGTFAARDAAWLGAGHRVRVGLQEVRILVLELHDRVPRPLRRQRRDDLLARREEERLHLLPA